MTSEELFMFGSKKKLIHVFVKQSDSVSVFNLKLDSRSKLPYVESEADLVYKGCTRVARISTNNHEGRG